MPRAPPDRLSLRTTPSNVLVEQGRPPAPAEDHLAVHQGASPSDVQTRPDHYIAVGALALSMRRDSAPASGAPARSSCSIGSSTASTTCSTSARSTRRRQVLARNAAQSCFLLAPPLLGGRLLAPVRWSACASARSTQVGVRRGAAPGRAGARGAARRATSMTSSSRPSPSASRATAPARRCNPTAAPGNGRRGRNPYHAVPVPSPPQIKRGIVSARDRPNERSDPSS